MLIRISISRKFDPGHTFLPARSITIAHASLYQMMATRASMCRYERRCASGSGPCHRRFVFYRRHMIPRFRLLRAMLVLLIFPGVLAAQSDDLLSRIWQGIGQAQQKYTSSCGTLTETRTSSLMAKPLVLRGKFCAEGTTRFALDYFEPSAMRIRFNENYLNVTTGDKTEVMEIGKSVRRAQSYFGRDSSLGNLKKLHHHRAREQPGLPNEAGSADGHFSPQAELPRREAGQTGFLSSVAGGRRQERRKQCIRHRRKLDESEDSGRYV